MMDRDTEGNRERGVLGGLFWRLKGGQPARLGQTGDKTLPAH